MSSVGGVGLVGCFWMGWLEFFFFFESWPGCLIGPGFSGVAFVCHLHERMGQVAIDIPAHDPEKSTWRSQPMLPASVADSDEADTLSM